MQIDPLCVWKNIQTIKETSPLIHNITNYVAMQQTANALLAIGAAPVMAHAIDEAESMAKIANALVLNIGTLSSPWIKGMKIAHFAANAKGIPIVFDPAGSGSTFYRTATANSILNQGRIAAIRGNASEIVSLIDDCFVTKGVESKLCPEDHIKQAKKLALLNHCIVVMSGSIDVITNGEIVCLVHNGDPLMTKSTGMGCIATALMGAFLATHQNSLLGSLHTMIVMGIAGEMAAKEADGPASFKIAFIDKLYQLTLDEIKKYLRAEVI